MAKVNPGSLFKPKNEGAQPDRDSTVGPKKPKRGKHLISGLFEEQVLLREALNDVFLKYGKPPIA